MNHTTQSGDTGEHLRQTNSDLTLFNEYYALLGFVGKEHLNQHPELGRAPFEGDGQRSRQIIVGG
jgi:hypothetical protein